MAIVRTELRAFPRLTCAKPASLLINGLRQVGQLMDLSLGGFKALPSELECLVDGDIQPGASISADLAGVTLSGRIVWATPNCSALGCAFDEAIPQTLLDYLLGADLALAAE